MVQNDWGCQNIPTLDVDRRKHCVSYLLESLSAENSTVAVIEVKRRQAADIDRLYCSFTDSVRLKDLIVGGSGVEKRLLWMVRPG